VLINFNTEYKEYTKMLSRCLNRLLKFNIGLNKDTKMLSRCLIRLVNLMVCCICGVVYWNLVSISSPICNDLEIWVCSGFFFFVYISLWCYIVGGKYKNLLQLVEVIFLISSVVLLVILVQIYQISVGLNASILVNSFYFIVSRMGGLFLVLNGCGEVCVPNVELMGELMKFSLVDQSSSGDVVLQVGEEPVGEYVEFDEEDEEDEEDDEDEAVEKFSPVPGYEAVGLIVILNILVHVCKFAPYIARELIIAVAA